MAAVGYGAGRLQIMLKGGDIREVAERLPADTPGLLAVRGAAELFLEFGGSAPDLSAVPALIREDMQLVHAQAIEALGFDPLTQEGWRSTGLDFFRPAGLSVDNLDPALLTARLVVPVADPAALALALPRVMEGLGLDVILTQIDDRPAWGLGNTALALDGDQLLGMSSAVDEFDALAALATWITEPLETTLADTDDFQRVLTGLGPKWHALTYVAAGMVRTLSQEALGQYPGLAGATEWLPSAAGYTVHLSDKRIRARYGAALPKEPPALFLGGPSSILDDISGDAVLALRIGLDVPAWLTWLENFPEMQSAMDYGLAMGSGFLGANLHTDGLENLSGRMGAVLLQPLDPSKAPLDAVAWAELKDGAASRVLVERSCAAAAAMLGLEPGPNPTPERYWCASDFMGLGLANDHLLLSVGGGRPEHLRDTLGKETSFLKSLPKSVQDSMEDDDFLSLWIDARSLPILANEEALPSDFRLLFSQLPAEALSEALPVSGISSSASLHKDFGHLDVAFHAGEEGFTGWMDKAGSHLQKLMETSSALTTLAAKPKMGTATPEAAANDDDGVAQATRELAGLQEAASHYEEAFGERVACSDEATATAALASGDNAWRTLDCWGDLGWLPTGAMTNWVEVGTDGFSVHGLVPGAEGEPVRLVGADVP
jgi:hypothetical protein